MVEVHSETTERRKQKERSTASLNSVYVYPPEGEEASSAWYGDATALVLHIIKILHINNFIVFVASQDSGWVLTAFKGPRSP